MGSDKPFIDVPAVIYVSLVVGNLIAIFRLPDYWCLWLLGAGFFVLCYHRLRVSRRHSPVTTEDARKDESL